MTLKELSPLTRSALKYELVLLFVLSLPIVALVAITVAQQRAGPLTMSVYWAALIYA